MGKKENRVLTIRLDKAHTDKLNETLKSTGIKTGSELFRWFLDQYPNFVQTRKNLTARENELFELNRDFRSLKEAIKTISKYS
jgi:hypothetical protein